ncbi:MAG: TetR/AcrR family transcriptional regulator [Bdellovibrionales bacterium]|nr:TetR/AcrR family transcriptional regulator [Bdellovibrionales bacterium]
MKSKKTKSHLGTKARALLEAQSLLQSFGFNGFSFQHVADRLRIKKPSLFEHFSSKEKMGQELVQEYHRTFQAWTKTIDALGSREKAIAFFSRLSRFSEEFGKVCPLSALIGDFHSLPKSIQRPLVEMYEFQLQWFQKVIREGQHSGVFRTDLSNQQLARMLMAVSLGSQWIGRVENKSQRICELQENFLNLISPQKARA